MRYFVLAVFTIISVSGCFFDTVGERIAKTRLAAEHCLCSKKMLQWEAVRWTNTVAVLDKTGSRNIETPVIVAAFYLPADGSRALPSLVVYWIDEHPQADSFVFYSGNEVELTLPALTSFRKPNEDAAKNGVAYSAVFWLSDFEPPPFIASGTNTYVSLHNTNGSLSERCLVSRVREDGTIDQTEVSEVRRK